MLQSGTNTVQAIGTKGGNNVADSLIWIIPILPPNAAIINPATPTVYLNNTNVILQLSATATDNQSNSPPALTTSWSRVSGPGTVTFGDTNALNTTANFSTNGVYSLAFQATKGATTTSAGLIVVVGNVPYGPTLKLRYAFDDIGSGTTTPSDTSGGGVDVTLQMLNKTGGSTNLSRSGKFRCGRINHRQPGLESFLEFDSRRQREFRCHDQCQSWFRKRHKFCCNYVVQAVGFAVEHHRSAHVRFGQQHQH